MQSAKKVVLKTNHKTILRKDIEVYLKELVDSAKEQWISQMSLPIAERVRKRKAIDNLTLVDDFHERTSANDHLIKVRFQSNISDFKEGDPLILHTEDSSEKYKCTLQCFENDTIILLISSYVYSSILLQTLSGQELILDQDVIDMTELYYYFTAQMPSVGTYWGNSILNKVPVPHFINRDLCERQINLDFTEDELTPSQREALVNSLSAEDYYLIQGPPGTGKTFLLSIILTAELKYFHHKVVVIAQNHMAINNVLEGFNKIAPGCPYVVAKVGQEYHAPKPYIRDDEQFEILNLEHLPVDRLLNIAEDGFIIGMTPYSFYSSRARDLTCDTLIIDEAGQMSIPLAMMGMIKAKKTILAGDDKQLAPIVSSDKISPKMKPSIFERLKTKDNCTLLDVSFRMCTTICEFVSDLFYDGSIRSNVPTKEKKTFSNDPIYDWDKPIIFHQITDNGKQTSLTEAKRIVNVIEQFIGYGVKGNDIGIISPFRAQAMLIRRLIMESGHIEEQDKKNIISDTVDRMQGQEREIIIYSMTAGNIEYMTEMGDFLYNPNKLNVAFSRAKYKLIVVGDFMKIKNLELRAYPHLMKMIKSPLVTHV